MAKASWKEPSLKPGEKTGSNVLRGCWTSGWVGTTVVLYACVSKSRGDFLPRPSQFPNDLRVASGRLEGKKVGFSTSDWLLLVESNRRPMVGVTLLLPPTPGDEGRGEMGVPGSSRFRSPPSGEPFQPVPTLALLASRAGLDFSVADPKL